MCLYILISFSLHFHFIPVSFPFHFHVIFSSFSVHFYLHFHVHFPPIFHFHVQLNVPLAFTLALVRCASIYIRNCCFHLVLAFLDKIRQKTTRILAGKKLRKARLFNYTNLLNCTFCMTSRIHWLLNSTFCTIAEYPRHTLHNDTIKSGTFTLRTICYKVYNHIPAWLMFQASKPVDSKRVIKTHTRQKKLPGTKT